MPPRWSLQPTYPIDRHDSDQPSGSIRKILVQQLVDVLHVCLLRGDVPRARRAWAILIRCREVDWRSRWAWGLEILNLEHTHEVSGRQTDDIERWLRALRVPAKEAEKPALLHALMLHMIKTGQYRAALDELDTYLLSYPYILSASLHVYAGMLAFYLAQPSDHTPQAGEADLRLLTQARIWFEKALSLDETEQVAQEFLALMDEREPERRSRTRSSSVNVNALLSTQPVAGQALQSELLSESSSNASDESDSEVRDSSNDSSDEG